MPHLAIAGTGEPPSHLAYDLYRPEAPVDPGRCLLYCHGFASSRSGDKATFFARRFVEAGLAFCRFDFRGHGDSSGELSELTLTRNLEDLERMRLFLRGEGFDRLVLMGSSMGGGSCIWFATRHPDEIDAAISIAPSLEMDRGLLSRMGPEKAARWEREGRILFEHELGARYLDWGLIEDLRTYDRRELGNRYRTPGLIFHGVGDETVSWRSVAELVESCAGLDLRLHLMADGDHRLVDRLPRLWNLAHQMLAERGWVSGAGSADG